MFKLLALFILANTFLLFPQDVRLSEDLPFDTTITKDTLDNGLVYYIKHNEKPENRAELRLVVNAGSILENEEQQGLAHFTEHMAFNGTEKYEKMEIVNFLESIGMRFGPDINAYTSFDETVYMLQLPADSMELLEKGFDILKEWAANISFDPEEVEKERGVVIEEWRLGRGAQARMRDEQFPVLFKNSKYAERLPIGKKEILENFDIETLKNFYNDWYRPSLMSVIAVGDFDKEKIEQIIHKTFSGLENPSDEKPRELFPVPDHEDVLFAIASDAEATQNSIALYFKHQVQEEGKVKNYRQSLIENLYNSMLNNRFYEITQQPDAPFLYGYSAAGRFVRSKEVYLLGAVVKSDEFSKALDALLTEAIRVEKYGFTETELERKKNEMLAYMEQAYNERDKTESSRLASEYIRNFLNDEPVPGIAFEYKLYKELLPGIKLEEVNKTARELISDSNMVVVVSATEKPDINIPGEEELMKVINEVENKEIAAYEDKVIDKPLIENEPKPGKIVSEEKVEDFGLIKIKLSNGATVLLKKTDFKNDEILFSAFSPGGTSLVDLDEHIPASTASAIINQSGIGDFDLIQLQKKLSGKVVDVSPYISDLSEGFSGSAAPKDIETMFKLIHLYFTSPRIDSSAFTSYLERLKNVLENRSASPDAVFQDTVKVTLTQYDPRELPWTLSTLEKLDPEQSLEIYQERFADASDFTFIFVGNFKTDSIKPFIETYLASLPDINRNEKWIDLNIDPPQGVIEKEVLKGIEQKSRVNLIFSGDFNWSYDENYLMNSLEDVLRIKLREVLREDKGGTYGVGVYANPQKIPDEEYRITISFGCDPERVDELVETTLNLIDSVKEKPVEDSYIQKVKETQRREREINLKENSYWLRTIRYYYFYNIDLNEFNRFEDRVENLSAEDIQLAAKKYFNNNNFIKIVLFPENYGSEKINE